MQFVPAIPGEKRMSLPVSQLGQSPKRILDATASNRSIWRKKESRHVLWIDIESELRVPPDMVLDCTTTGFEAERFHTIFFDPPHWWGDETGENYFACRNDADEMKLQKRYGIRARKAAYYGADKFKSKSELLVFIHKAQKEFCRILKDEGILWLNWSEVKIPLGKILPFFRNWDEMIRLTIGSKAQSLGDFQNYWVMFMKKDGPHQAELPRTFTKGGDILDKKVKGKK